jgi:hypothetical protein
MRSFELILHLHKSIVRAFVDRQQVTKLKPLPWPQLSRMIWLLWETHALTSQRVSWPPRLPTLKQRPSLKELCHGLRCSPQKGEV